MFYLMFRMYPFLLHDVALTLPSPKYLVLDTSGEGPSSALRRSNNMP